MTQEQHTQGREQITMDEARNMAAKEKGYSDWSDFLNAWGDDADEVDFVHERANAIFYTYPVLKERDQLQQEVEGLRAALKELTDGLQEIAEAEGRSCSRCEGNGKLWADGQAHYPSYDGPTVNCGKCGGEGKIYPDLQGMIQDLLNAAAEGRGGNEN